MKIYYTFSKEKEKLTVKYWIVLMNVTHKFLFYYCESQYSLAKYIYWELVPQIFYFNMFFIFTPRKNKIESFTDLIQGTSFLPQIPEDRKCYKFTVAPAKANLQNL